MITWLGFPHSKIKWIICSAGVEWSGAGMRCKNVDCIHLVKVNHLDIKCGNDGRELAQDTGGPIKIQPIKTKLFDKILESAYFEGKWRRSLQQLILRNVFTECLWTPWDRMLLLLSVMDIINITSEDRSSYHPSLSLIPRQVYTTQVCKQSQVSSLFESTDLSLLIQTSCLQSNVEQFWCRLSWLISTTDSLVKTVGWRRWRINGSLVSPIMVTE